MSNIRLTLREMNESSARRLMTRTDAKQIFGVVSTNVGKSVKHVPWLTNKTERSDTVEVDRMKKIVGRDDSYDMDQIIDVFKKKLETKRLWKELMYYLVFLTLFILYIYNQRSVADSYQQHMAVTDMLVDEEFPLEFTHILKSFDDVGTEEEMWQWAKGVLFPQIDNELIYNSFVQIGGVRIRQLKVKADCVVPESMKELTGTKCFPKFSSSSEDKEDFGEWKYSKDLDIPSYWGKLASSYPGNGFVVDVKKRSNYSSVIENLENNGFITRGTRAIFFHLFLHNVNTDYTTSFWGAFEYGPGGLVMPRSVISTFKLVYFKGISVAGRIVVEIFFLVSLIGYVIIMVKEFLYEKKNGKWYKYLLNTWNILDIINVIIFFIIIFMYIAYLANNDRRNANVLSKDFVNLTNVSKKFSNIFNINAVNIFLTVMKVFKYLRMNPAMLILWDVISTASADLVVFFAFFMIVFFAFAIMGLVLFGPALVQFRDFQAAVISCFQMAIGGAEYSEFQSVNRVLGPFFYILFVFFIVLVLVNMFLAIIDFAYDELDELTSSGTIKRMLRNTFLQLRGALKRGYHFIRRKRLTDQDADDAISKAISDAEVLRMISNTGTDGDKQSRRLSIHDLQQKLGEDRRASAVIDKIHNTARNRFKAGALLSGKQVTIEDEVETISSTPKISQLNNKMDLILQKLQQKSKPKED